jgi:predicted nucleic acid-binding protein
MTEAAVVDTNVLVRHLTADSAEHSPRATHFLESAAVLILTDVVIAECVHVLESVYDASPTDVAARLRGLLEMRSVRVIDTSLLERAFGLYESGMKFVDGYLVAVAERSSAERVASFDRGIDRVDTVERLEP